MFQKYKKSKEKKTGRKKSQGEPQSQTAVLPRHQEEVETDKIKQALIQQRKKTKISSIFPYRGNRNAEKHKNKITLDKT